MPTRKNFPHKIKARRKDALDRLKVRLEKAEELQLTEEQIIRIDTEIKFLETKV